jgi:hypothetical protein
MDNSRRAGQSRGNENLNEIVGDFGPVLEVIKWAEGPPVPADSSEVLVLLEKEVAHDYECARKVETHSFPPVLLNVRVEEKVCGIHLVKKKEL